MSNVQREKAINQDGAAALVRAMAHQYPWSERPFARAALAIAARAIERGRHLTGPEKLRNLRRALSEDEPLSSQERRGPCRGPDRRRDQRQPETKP